MYLHVVHVLHVLHILHVASFQKLGEMRSDFVGASFCNVFGASWMLWMLKMLEQSDCSEKATVLADGSDSSSCDSSCCVRCLCGSPTGSATSAVGAARSSPTASTKFQPEGAQGTRRRRRKVVEASPCSGHWFSRWHSLESGGAKYHPRGARVLSRATTEGIQKGTFSTSTSSTIGVQLFFQLFNYGAAGWPWDRSHHWYQHD